MTQAEEEKIAAQDSGESQGNQGHHTHAAKKSRRKWPIVVGVCVLVLAVAGAGFWTWHEQPSFCNAICHSPMDPYVEGYYSDDTTQLCVTHAKANVTCLECHEAKIDEQVAEAESWVTGNYQTDEDGMIHTVGVNASKDFCAKSGCHDWDSIVSSTENWGGVEGVNPHENHNSGLDCSTCHTAHGTSVMACNTCHDWETPEGWTDPAASMTPQN